MGLSKKRKEHLAQITARAAESKKARKIDGQSQQQKWFLRKQREGRDEHEDIQSESSSDESRFDESNLDEEDLELDDENTGVDDGRGDNTQEGLGDIDGGIQLEDEDPIFRPVWKDNAGGYLRGVRGCGSSTTRKRERQQKRELEKSASTTRSIVGMFLAQSKKFHLLPHQPPYQPPYQPFPQKVQKGKWKKHDMNYKLEPLKI